MRNTIVEQAAAISSQLEKISSQGLKIQDSPFEKATAIGTLLAVFVALFAVFWPSILRRWNKPKLIFEFDNKEPYCRKIPNILDPKTGKITLLNSYYVRLRIKNTGRFIARDCKGKLIAIAHKDLGTLRQDFDPVILRWVGNYNSSGMLDINSREYEYLDIFNTNEESDRFHIAAIDYSIPRGITMDPQRDDYFILVSIYAENADPIEEVYRITNGSGYDGAKLSVATKREKQKIYRLL